MFKTFSGLLGRLGKAAPQAGLSTAWQAGYFYGDPAYVEAERALQERIGGQMGRQRAELLRRGYSPEDAERMLAPLRAGAMRAFQELYTRQAGIEQQRAEAAAERRRRRRHGFLGFLSTLPFGIAGLFLQAKDIGRQREFGNRYLDIMGRGLESGTQNPYDYYGTRI